MPTRLIPVRKLSVGSARSAPLAHPTRRTVLTFRPNERESVDGQKRRSRHRGPRPGPPRRRNRRAARKAAAKSTARKKIKAKGGRPRRPSARVRSSASPSAITARRISRPMACALTRKYRDLGIADATQGLARAHVIRLIGPCNPAEVSKLHFHDVEFQMVYVLKGWVKTYMEGQGETLMQRGQRLDPAAAHQAPDHGLFRRRRIAGSDPARGIQDRRTRGMMASASSAPADQAATAVQSG